MIRAIGYAGVCLGLPNCSVSRTVRLANATPDRLRELISLNLCDLQKILEYNCEHQLCMFRINQAIIPLGSHPINTVPWWEEHESGPLLRRLGSFIHSRGLRVSMHPGQYTVLNSLSPATVQAAIAELETTTRILDTMGLDFSHKVVIHGGAGRPDRVQALNRLESSLQLLSPQALGRLVLENDERVFSVDQLLPVCRAIRLPLVFDSLHHHANPGNMADWSITRIMEQVVSTWGEKDGLPKVHFSSQDPDKRAGAHAYWLDPDEFRELALQLAPFNVDVMAECKGKDLAVLRLREELGYKPVPCCRPEVTAVAGSSPVGEGE